MSYICGPLPKGCLTILTWILFLNFVCHFFLVNCSWRLFNAITGTQNQMLKVISRDDDDDDEDADEGWKFQVQTPYHSDGFVHPPFPKKDLYQNHHQRYGNFQKGAIDIPENKLLEPPKKWWQCEPWKNKTGWFCYWNRGLYNPVI